MTTPPPDEPDETADERPLNESDRLRSQFDAIVEGLDLQVPDPVVDEPPARPTPRAQPQVPDELLEFDDLPDEPFYRQAPPIGLTGRDLPTTLALVGVFGAPGLLVLCTLLRIFLPRPVVIGAALIFVAGAIYLIARLPERRHGPLDEPDDGVAL